MRIGLSGGGTTSRPPRSAGSRRRGRRLHEPLVRERDLRRSRSSPWPSRAVRQRPSSSARRCCRPTPVTRCCKPTVRRLDAAAMGRPGLTLGVGPSHQPVIEGAYGLSYDQSEHTPRSTSRCSARSCAARASSPTASTSASTSPITTVPQPVSVMLSALAPRLLRVAGELTDGTILWMANARAIETHVAPR